MLTWPSKKPLEIEDYDIDWSQRLAAGDAIISSNWVIQGSATSLVIVSTAATPTFTKAFLSGGTLGQTYVLICTVTTFLGDTLIAEVAISILDA